MKLFNYAPFMTSFEPKLYPVPQTELENALAKAHTKILSHRHKDSYWWYTLEANDSINAETIFLLKYLGLEDTETQNGIAQWLLHNQNFDGSWSLYHGGQGDLSATAECYLALKMTGFAPDSDPLTRARQFILDKGGLTKIRIFSRIHLALFGLVSWRICPKMPIGLIQLPEWSPINIYEFSSWARASIVPLLVIMDTQKSVPLDFDLDELYTENPARAKWTFDSDRSFLSIDRLFIHADRALKVADRIKFKPLRKNSQKKCEKYIREHLSATEDIFPALFYGSLALNNLGYDNTDDSMQTALKALSSFRIKLTDSQNALNPLPFASLDLRKILPKSMIYQQCCLSPIWDTAWAGVALLEAGHPPTDPLLQETAKWLLAKQVTDVKGDWSVKNPKTKPGGWSFEFINKYYPDTDDTIEVLTFLYHCDLSFKQLNKNFKLGLDWLLSMQCHNGGFAAFDRNNDFELLNKIPFSDHGACLDPATVDITGRVIEFLMTICDFEASSPLLNRAADFIIKNQEKDGSFWGRWGVNYLYGTWCALSGLGVLKRPQDRLAIQRAIKWLKSIQNPDGGFGESCQSYLEDRYLPLNESVPSQTAWALMGLILAGEGNEVSAQKAAEFLIHSQCADGGWDEKHFTGSGFPGHFYIRYHGYRYYFPLLALARYKKTIG